MLTFDEAQARLLAEVKAPSGIEVCAITHAAGRVLALDVIANVDLPPADNSAMDGYAVRYAEVRLGQAMVVGPHYYAGEVPPALPTAQAARIFTGGVLPEGADTVVIQENCDASGGLVTVRELPKPGANIRRRGEDIASGTRLITAGTVLEAGHLALLASQGFSTVAVRPRLKVAILTTGDELIPPGQQLLPGAIYESNSILLSSALTKLGCEVVALRHARDDISAISEALQALANCADIVLSAGGVSVGDRDLVKPALQALGGDLALWKVKMKPGKPVALGRVAGVPVLGLPGNPVSAYVVLAVLASPMLRKMQGRAQYLPPVSQAVLRTTTDQFDSREAFLRVQENQEGTRITVQAHPSQSSGILHGLAWATGLARVPAAQALSDGAEVAYYRFSDWLS